MSNAFIGVSLDSKLFTDDWWCAVFPEVLRHHERLTILIADELLRFTRTAHNDGGRARLNLRRSDALVERRCSERSKQIQRLLRTLQDEDTSRVAVLRYSDCSDYLYANLLRKLRIAYSTLQGFRLRLQTIASEYVRSHHTLMMVPGAVEACCDFALDEVAMCLRVTELESHTHEYNPYEQLPIIWELYEGRFADEGLTVFAMTGIAPRRVYTVFSAPKG